MITFFFFKLKNIKTKNYREHFIPRSQLLCYQFLFFPFYFSIYLSNYLSICLSVCMSVCLTVCPSVCQSFPAAEIAWIQGDTQVCIYSVLLLLYNSLCLSVRQSVSHSPLLRLPGFKEKHRSACICSCYNSIIHFVCPSVCQSFLVAENFGYSPFRDFSSTNS